MYTDSITAARGLSVDTRVLGRRPDNGSASADQLVQLGHECVRRDDDAVRIARALVEHRAPRALRAARSEHPPPCPRHAGRARRRRRSARRRTSTGRAPRTPTRRMSRTARQQSRHHGGLTRANLGVVGKAGRDHRGREVGAPGRVDLRAVHRRRARSRSPGSTRPGSGRARRPRRRRSRPRTRRSPRTPGSRTGS